MALVSLISPMDQPPGKRRLLADLKSSLADPRFKTFRLVVAYAKSGPLNRLRSDMQAWRAKGHKTEAIIGIDQHGTSFEALGLALDLFDAVFVTQEYSITFHPKIYFFKGPDASRAFIGSNNLTVGGTETNFESAVQLDLSPKSDTQITSEIERAWNELLPSACAATRRLDALLLAKLVADGDVLQEKAMRTFQSNGSGSAARKAVRSGMALKPPSALPRIQITAPKKGTEATATGSKPTAASIDSTPATVPAIARSLAIQIKPHHNGEIFLSVIAARQYPAFFQWPFNGATTPKKVGNPSYPQLVPDPIVNIDVFGASIIPLLSLNAYNLNTIYYEKKSEIRITASPLVGVVPDYSVMIMQTSSTQGIDYDITIHTPSSQDYGSWLAACNQEMPGGGRKPRKYGWF
jgi:HKD family nuclease